MMENGEFDGFPVFTSLFIHRFVFFLKVGLSLLQLHHVLLVLSVLLPICHLHMTLG